MNLDLPFEAPAPGELDAQLARIDPELDTLFLDEVQATLAALHADPPAEAAA